MEQLSPEEEGRAGVGFLVSPCQVKRALAGLPADFLNQEASRWIGLSLPLFPTDGVLDDEIGIQSN